MWRDRQDLVNSLEDINIDTSKGTSETHKYIATDEFNNIIAGSQSMNG